MTNTFKEGVEKLRLFLASRRQAYRLVFNPENVYTEKVLADLARFCRANDTSFHPDPRMHAVLEGRREVWLRIQHHLKLDQEQLWQTYGRKGIE